MDMDHELLRICDLLRGTDHVEILSGVAAGHPHGVGAGHARLRPDFHHGSSGPGNISGQTLRHNFWYHDDGSPRRRGGGPLGHGLSARRLGKLYDRICDRYRHERVVGRGDLYGVTSPDPNRRGPAAQDASPDWRQPANVATYRACRYQPHVWW